MICLDSSFLIDFLRGKIDAIEKASQIKEDSAITTISIYEVMIGFHMMKNKSQEKINIFMSTLNNYEILNLDISASLLSSEIYAKLVSAGEMIDHLDCMIAGIMKSNEISSIITRNEKHFNRIGGIKTISY